MREEGKRNRKKLKYASSAKFDKGERRESL